MYTLQISRIFKNLKNTHFNETLFNKALNIHKKIKEYKKQIGTLNDAMENELQAEHKFRSKNYFLCEDILGLLGDIDKEFEDWLEHKMEHIKVIPEVDKEKIKVYLKEIEKLIDLMIDNTPVISDESKFIKDYDQELKMVRKIAEEGMKEINKLDLLENEEKEKLVEILMRIKKGYSKVLIKTNKKGKVEIVYYYANIPEKELEILNLAKAFEEIHSPRNRISEEKHTDPTPYGAIPHYNIYFGEDNVHIYPSEHKKEVQNIFQKLSA